MELNKAILEIPIDRCLSCLSKGSSAATLALGELVLRTSALSETVG